MNTNEVVMTDLLLTPDWVIAMAADREPSVNNEDDDSSDGDILEGRRNETLFKEGCSMRRQGRDYEEIVTVLWNINKERCKPPLEGKEVNDIAQRAATYAPASSTSDSKSEGEKGKTSGFYSSLAEMLAADIPDTEEIVLGIGRGEVGMLVSVTNVGKTTLMLNLALSLSAGQQYAPLASGVAKPMRVLYCDFEARDSKQKPYLMKMLESIGNSKLASTNFIPLNTPVLNDEQLNLSNPAHIKYLTQYAREHRADLIIIDTVGAAFDLQDENSNAEVTKRALKPMIKMAREANAALLFCHHAGKPSESSIAEKAYAGRGASAWGGLSRGIFLLSRSKKHGKDYVVLECTKVKGTGFEPVLLRLNRETAYFEQCDEKPEIEQDIDAQQIAKFIDSKGEVRRKEIIEYFKDRTSAETIDRRLEVAVKHMLIDKPKSGIYRSRSKHNNTSLQNLV